MPSQALRIEAAVSMISINPNIPGIIIPSGDATTLIGLILAAAAAVWLLTTFGGFIRLFFTKGAFMLRSLFHEFDETITLNEKRFLELKDDDVRQRPAKGKWSKKEILGHMVDSACNNHQRFVLAQLSSELRFPAYNQSGWVRVQNYEEESWPSLVQFWSSYNRHLLHVMTSIPAERLKGLCFVGEDEPVTLEFLIRDYVRHVNHHAEQIRAVRHD